VRGGDQRLDQLDHPGQGGRGFPQAGMDEPVGDLGAGHVGDQLPAPLDRDVLVDQQVDGQGAQPRADGQRRVRHAGRARRDVLAAARAPGGVHVVLDPPGPRLGDVQLLRRRRHSQVTGLSQVPPARARARREVRDGVIRDFPPHRRPGSAGLLAAAAPAARLSAAVLLLRRRTPGNLIRGGRHRAVPAVAGQGTLQPGDLLAQRRDLVRLRAYRVPQLARQVLQLRDPRIPGSASSAIRGSRRQGGHKS